MFKAQDLSVLAYANNFTLWHYTTTDKLSTILEEGYFNNAADMLRTNDLMTVNVDTDGEAATKFITVTSHDADGQKVSIKQY